MFTSYFHILHSLRSHELQKVALGNCKKYSDKVLTGRQRARKSSNSTTASKYFRYFRSANKHAAISDAQNQKNTIFKWEISRRKHNHTCPCRVWMQKIYDENIAFSWLLWYMQACNTFWKLYLTGEQLFVFCMVIIRSSMLISKFAMRLQIHYRESFIFSRSAHPS